MNQNNFVLSSKTIDIAQSEDYLTLTNRVCFYDSPNLNNVQLDYDDSSLEKAQTLVGMPVVAKYVKQNGKDNLSGHAVQATKNGLKFDTAAIGVVLDVSIKNEEVMNCSGEVGVLPCLYSTQRIWTRFENATNAILRLYSEDNLHNSWELKSSEYTFKDGIKHISNYAFVANCLLGDTTTPAYGASAKIVALSEDNESEYFAAECLAEALAEDIASMPVSNKSCEGHNDRKGELEVEEIQNIETSEEVTVDSGEETVNEVSEQSPAVNEDSSVAENIESAKEDESKEDGEPTSDEENNNEEDKEKEESECGNDKDKEKSECVDDDKDRLKSELDAANQKIAELEKTVAELSEFKKELDVIKAEQEAKDKAIKVENLRNYVIKSNRFTQEEIESEAVKNAIENLDEAWLKNEIADRFMSSVEDVEVSSTKDTVEVSENVSVILSNSNDATSEDIMKAFFKN